jgi:hypothetical protein
MPSSHSNQEGIGWKKIVPDTYAAGFEIPLKNHKSEDAVVRFVEPIPGDWTIIRSSHKHSKQEALTAEFTLRIPGDKEGKLTDRVKMRF